MIWGSTLCSMECSLWESTYTRWPSLAFAQSLISDRPPRILTTLTCTWPTMRSISSPIITKSVRMRRVMLDISAHSAPSSTSWKKTGVTPKPLWKKSKTSSWRLLSRVSPTFPICTGSASLTAWTTQCASKSLVLISSLITNTSHTYLRLMHHRRLALTHPLITRSRKMCLLMHSRCLISRTKSESK